MAPESVSFRITRTAEDLAQTVTALSHRLVRLEQRLGALEAAIDQRQEPEPAELDVLDHVEVLLRDCRMLLDEPPAPEPLEYLAHQAVGDEFPNAA
jgi:DNA-binding transcriptional LysR family regulator